MVKKNHLEKEETIQLTHIQDTKSNILSSTNKIEINSNTFRTIFKFKLHFYFNSFTQTVNFFLI